MRKPTKTKSVSAGTRIYYFDVYTDAKNTPYLAISEIPLDRNPGKKERQRIFVHAEDIGNFREALNEISVFFNIHELFNDNAEWIAERARRYSESQAPLLVCKTFRKICANKPHFESFDDFRAQVINTMGEVFSEMLNNNPYITFG